MKYSFSMPFVEIFMFQILYGFMYVHMYLYTYFRQSNFVGTYVKDSSSQIRMCRIYEGTLHIWYRL